MAWRVTQGQERGVGLGDWLLLDDFGGSCLSAGAVLRLMVSLGMWMWIRVRVWMGTRIHTRLLLVGHAQEVHLAEERLAKDKDPDEILGRIWVGKVTTVPLLLVEIMHLRLISEAKRLDRRTGTVGGEVVTMNVAPCAHVLCKVAHAVGAKRASVGAREVRLEHGRIEVPDVLTSLARIVTDSRAVEDVHELLRCAPVERERAMPRQLGGRPGKVVALALALALILTMDLALAPALALALALAVTLALALALAALALVRVVVWVRMRRGRRMCHGRLAVHVRSPGIGGWGWP